MARYGEGSSVGMAYPPAPSSPTTSGYVLPAAGALTGGALLRRAIAPGTKALNANAAESTRAAQSALDEANARAAAAKIGRRGRARAQVATAQRNVNRARVKQRTVFRATPKLNSVAHRAKKGSVGAGLVGLSGVAAWANSRRGRTNEVR